MTKLQVNCLSISLDGFGAGPSQDLQNPLGVGGRSLHDWLFATRTFGKMHGNDAGATGIDDNFAAKGVDKIGAWIIGRNMFGPIRGAWHDEDWKGWWGDTPPFHTPVFVLTNHSRKSLEMDGGTTFHFVTGGVRDVLAQATKAADGKDVRLGGGVSTIRQYLSATLVDEMHVAIVPILLGSGEHLLTGLDVSKLGYECVQHVLSPKVMHFVLGRRKTWP